VATTSQHLPVLLEPALAALRVESAACVVDGTYGRGGHSRAILDRLSERARLIVIDRDPEAIADARAHFGQDRRVSVWPGNFADLGRMAEELDVFGQIQAILLDLGVSSPQLDSPQRGFSFLHDGPLDMRMDPDSGESAAAWLARASEQDIARVVLVYGEERHARRIARRIVLERADRPIETTRQLAAIVAGAVGRPGSERHPATRTFQAIRIQVNDELGALERALDEAIGVLAHGGRLAVISFHSLEDRCVKQTFRRWSSPPPGNRRQPVDPEFQALARRVGGLIRPDQREVNVNPRARSARLRVVEKLPVAQS